MADQTVADVVAYRRSDELISVPASASVAEAVAVMAEREVGAVLLGGSLMLLYGGVTPEPALGPFLGVGAISVLTAVVMIIIQMLGADPAAR